jgi:hypothetical protein
MQSLGVTQLLSRLCALPDVGRPIEPALEHVAKVVAPLRLVLDRAPHQALLRVHHHRRRAHLQVHPLARHPTSRVSWYQHSFFRSDSRIEVGPIPCLNSGGVLGAE